jgi:hypothetical protein
VTVVFACSYPSPASFDSSVCGYIDLGGAQFAGQTTNDAGTCPSDASAAAAPPILKVGASDVQFVVFVRAPAGPWTVSVTASGALSTVVGEAGGSESATFTADGTSQTELLFPLLTVAPGGAATVQVDVGSTSETFAFEVNAAAPPGSPSCIDLEAGTEATALAWAVVPPPPPTVADGVEGGSTAEAGTAVGTLIVDVEATLVDCSGDAGLPAYSFGTVSVQGTGGLSPASPTSTADSRGNVVFQLSGPAVPALSDSIAAVLTTAGGGLRVVQVTKLAGSP